MDTFFQTIGGKIEGTSPTTWIFFLAILFCIVLFRKLTR